MGTGALDRATFQPNSKGGFGLEHIAYVWRILS